MGHFYLRKMNEDLLAGHKILKIIGCGNSLRLSSSKKVLHNWISVIAERDLDWAFKSVDIPSSS